MPETDFRITAQMLNHLLPAGVSVHLHEPVPGQGKHDKPFEFRITVDDTGGDPIKEALDGTEMDAVGAMAMGRNRIRDFVRQMTNSMKAHQAAGLYSATWLEAGVVELLAQLATCGNCGSWNSVNRRCLLVAPKRASIKGPVFDDDGTCEPHQHCLRHPVQWAHPGDPAITHLVRYILEVRRGVTVASLCPDLGQRCNPEAPTDECDTCERRVPR